MRHRRNFHDNYNRKKEQGQCADDCVCRECVAQAALVEKVVCSKDVQKTAEFVLPFAIGPLTGTGTLTPTAVIGSLIDLLGVGTLVNVRVNPDFTRIEQEVTVIKDKIINMGYIPATLDVETAVGVIGLRIPIRIFFQEHTDCPGVCPGDQVIETTPEVEATFNQPLIGTDDAGATFVNFHLFKAILRTHLTVIRQGIEKNGKFCDLNANRCDSTGTPATINIPLELTPNTTQFPLGGALPALANNTTPNNNNQNNTEG